METHEMTADITKAESCKKDGNENFQKGNLSSAIESYSSALNFLVKHEESMDSKYIILQSTSLSNRALCRLKISEKKSSSKELALDSSKLAEKDCNDALHVIDCGTSTLNKGELSSLRAKILYRRAKARFLQTNVFNNGDIEQDDKNKTNKLLNEAAKDLLDLLSFDRKNISASTLLRHVRERHGSNKTSPVAQAISELQKYQKKAAILVELSIDDRQKLYCDRFDCLKMIYGHLCQDVSSISMELGRKDAISTLSQIASSNDELGGEQSKDYLLLKSGPIDHYSKSRALSIQILSLSATYHPFAVRYLKPNQFKQSILFDIVLSCEKVKNIDLAISAISLMLRIVIAFHKEQSISNDDKNSIFTDQFVDGITISKICVICLKSYTPDDNRMQKAAMDLLSTWTSSDWEEISLSASSLTSIGDGSTSSNRKKYKKKTESEIRSLPPKEFAAYRKKEYESVIHRKTTSKRNVLLFCGELMGGLHALLQAALQCGDDNRTRKEIGLIMGRILHVLIIDDGSSKEKEEGNVVKELVGPLLGYDGSNDREEEKVDGVIIEEIYDDEDLDDKEAECKISEEDQLKQDMKKALLTSSLLLCSAEVGSWALSDGWDNGEGTSRLSKLIDSGDFVAMSIASELLSSVASVEKARPLLGSFVQDGYFESLLKHENGDIRSGAASAMAKLGLASKAVDGADGEGEVMGLLQVASDLLYEAIDNADETSKLNFERQISNGLNQNRQASTATERGIELLSYLASKTLVKEELAFGFRSSKSPKNTTTLDRLVEMTRDENTVGDSITSYGIALIFAHMAVSLETLRKEAFIGKDVTAEQYEELQSLAKTEEEKASAKEAAELEKDLPEAVNERIRKMASADVPLGMVKLMDTCGYNNDNGHGHETTLEQLVVGMERMAIEPSVRGIMIQQGCLSSCIKIEKGDSNSEKRKKILRCARHCISKILITTNPNLLTSAQRLGSIGPMIQLVNDNESSDLAKFEALLSITNVASTGMEAKNRIISDKGIPILTYAMFSDHEMVRRAATEAMSNLIPHQAIMEHLGDGEKLRLWVSFASDFEENFDCAKAASGCLAMASADLNVARSLVKCKNFNSMITSLLECGNLDLMHRVLVVLLNLLDLKDPTCLEGVLETGAIRFCEAYAASFGEGITRRMEELGLSDEDEGMMEVTLDLAKNIVSSIG